MTRTRALAVLLIAIAFLSWPCRRGTRVADLDVDIGFLEATLSDNLFSEMAFRFQTSSSFVAPAADSDVYVELRSGSRLLAEDVFAPPTPTSAWQREKNYAWIRRIYIPPFIDEFSPSFKGSETLSATVGFTAPSAGGVALRSPVLTRKFRVAPAANVPVILYLDGWYPPESAPGNPAATWRWTGRVARCALDNPGRDALLVIRGDVGVPATPGSVPLPPRAAPKIVFRLDNRVLDEFTPAGAEFEKSYRLAKEELGTGKDLILSIAVDPAIMAAPAGPGAKDGRELGIRISLLYFR